ncbi:hypothetical protein OK006_11092 [Actinobacteria bacterium OK006]|nr:hypothetical protein OK006_11092 [Actinobacteria bacterium OK006]
MCGVQVVVAGAFVKGAAWQEPGANGRARLDWVNGSGDLREVVAKALELAGFGTWPDEDGGLWLRADGDAVLVGWNAEGLLATTAALHRDSGRDLERMRKALYTAVAATLSGSALAVTELGEELRVTLPPAMLPRYTAAPGTGEDAAPRGLRTYRA